MGELPLLQESVLLAQSKDIQAKRAAIYTYIFPEFSKDFHFM